MSTSNSDKVYLPQPHVRWLTLIGTLITQFSLGSVYTWSLFNAPFANKLHSSVTSVACTFGILCLGLAIASSLAGKLQDKFGVKIVTFSAGVLMLIGLTLTGTSSSLLALWLAGGVLVGVADGAGYLLTLTNCVRWFPEHKGFLAARV